MSPDLKRKLYDRLKQGCLRLGYRPSKDLLLQKRINNHEDDDGDLPQYAAEPSEHSTITERTSPANSIDISAPTVVSCFSDSVRSEVFYMCDGQWRSGDWQTVGVSTVAKRQNSAVLSLYISLCVDMDCRYGRLWFDVVV